MRKRAKNWLKKIWHFIWEDDSIWSWIVNIILAFVLIKFIVYPGLGLVLGTNYPVVAVVSGSMEHEISFDDWWHSQETFYQPYNITRSQFEKFPLHNGFNRGDIIVLTRAVPENLKIGDVIVFKSRRPDPIIHRVVSKWNEGEVYYFATKGDHNAFSIKDYAYDGSKILDETNIPQQDLLGKAQIKIPWLGYIKIWFVDLINFILRK